MSTVPFNSARKYSLPSDIAQRLPSNLEAERSVLGAILLDNRCVSDVAGEMHVDDFFLSQHQKIFSAMLGLAEQRISSGQALTGIDLVTLTEFLHRQDKLESAGGAAYLASLIDGMPRVTNVRHYAAIVTEKARMRRIIRLSHDIQMRAFEGEESPDQLLENAESMLKQFSRKNGDNPAVVVDFHELLGLKLPDPQWCVEPLLTRGGTMMLYSWAGWGKSYIATEMAFSLATGTNVIFGGHRGGGGKWPLFGPMRVMYLYGEMHGSRIRERIIQIAKGHGTNIPEKDFLGLMSKDYQTIERAPRCARAWRPSIVTAQDRKYVEERFFGGGYELLVLDNISTLWSAAQEEQSKQMAVLKDWFIDLNMRGVMVLFLQHAGKSGDFLGDSSQIHILDSVLKLKHPGNYKKAQGLRVLAEIEKNRYECRDPRWLSTFEVKLEVTPEMGAQWLTRPAYEAQREASFEMFRRNMKPPEVSIEIGIGRSTAYRYYEEYRSQPDAKHWSELEGAEE
jgi:hypothetical protein